MHQVGPWTTDAPNLAPNPSWRHQGLASCHWHTRVLLAFLGLLLLVAIQSVQPAVAEKGEIAPLPPPGERLVQTRLIVDQTAVVPGATVRVGLEQIIPQGWHTYWRNPGDSGAATTIAWTLPEGAQAGPFRWPTPTRLPFGPLMNFGYSDEVLLVSDIRLPDTLSPGTTITLAGEVELLVCADICIPEFSEVTVELAIADSLAVPSRHFSAFEAHRTALPQPVDWPAVYRAPEADGERGEVLDLFLEEPALSALSAESLARTFFYPYQGGLIQNAAPPRASRGESGLHYQIAANSGKFPPPEGLVQGVLVFEEPTGPRAYEITAKPATPDYVEEGFGVLPAAAAAGGAGDGSGLSSETSGGTPQGTSEGASGGTSLALAIGFAFLGGLLLNLMPCVFPVLFMKAMAFLNHGGDARALRVGGLAYTAGVMLSFLSLAAVLIALKAGGSEIGWGFQLQSPLIVLLLAYVMLALGLNLSGVYEVPGRLAGIGDGLTQSKGASGSFFTGVLAVIVASPCTAPFMGAALGFALVQSAGTSLLVFAALGLGMALPFLVLSFAPGLAARLPKPGAWMEEVKQLLAFALYATVAWLIWVYTAQVDRGGQFVGLLGLVLLALAAHAFGRHQRAQGQSLVSARIALAGLSLVAALGLSTVPQSVGGPSSAAVSGPSALVSTPFPEAEEGSEGEGLQYTAYSPEQLATLREAGTPVFINFTADWCISCLVNERRVLNRADVAAAFDRAGIATLKGDWTRQDPLITRKLGQFGRSGVPLYLFYPAGQSEAQVLPQILSVDGMLDLADGGSFASR